MQPLRALRKRVVNCAGSLPLTMFEIVSGTISNGNRVHTRFEAKQVHPVLDATVGSIVFDEKNFAPDYLKVLDRVLIFIENPVSFRSRKHKIIISSIKAALPPSCSLLNPPAIR